MQEQNFRSGTFFRVPNQFVRAAHELGPAAMCVYLALAQHCYGKKVECWPSLDRLVEVTGLSNRKSVLRGLKRLESHGWLRRTPGGGRGSSTVYELVIGPVAKLRNSVPADTVLGGETVSLFAEKGVPDGPETVSGGTHEENNEEDKNARERAASSSPASPDLPPSGSGPAGSQKAQDDWTAEDHERARAARIPMIEVTRARRAGMSADELLQKHRRAV